MTPCKLCNDDGVVVHEDFVPYGDGYVLRREDVYCDCEAGAARERFDKYVFDPVEEKLEEEV